MNSKQRNHIKKEIEAIKVKNWQLTSGLVVWCIVGIITLITIVGPYLCYGYAKKYKNGIQMNKVRIKELEGRITLSL